MSPQQDDLTKLISRVLNEMVSESAAPVRAGDPAGAGYDGVCETLDQGMEMAVKAQKRLVAMSLDDRRKMIQAVRDVTLQHSEELANMAVSETGLGRVEDKLKENKLAAEKTPGVEDIEPRACTGDDGLTLLEYAPVGVIGALTPVTNATGTLINNTISMIAAGNSVVFNAHPSAKQTTRFVVRLFHKAMTEAGGPAGLVNAVAEPTLDTANALMKHPQVNMLVATGGKHVVTAVLSSGKKAVGAGAGNPPVLVDETACLKHAAKSIVDGHSINNNIFCISEKEVIVVDEVADTLVKFMAETGKAMILTPEMTDKITKLVVTPDNHASRDFIGKNVQVILEAAGIPANENLRCAVMEVPKDHPLVRIEQMMPILPVVRVKDVWEGIELAVEVEQGNRHTAMMHSTNIEHLTAFARAVQTTIFVKNGPSYAGIGLGGEGHSSFTLAGPTGEGITSARTFTRQRRCVMVDSFRII